MRWYKILIYDDDKASGEPLLKFQSHTSYPRHENPTPLNIQFEYANSINKNGEYARAILLNLFIYSQSIQLFTYLAKLKKKYLQFYAGFDRQAPLSKANGYTATGNAGSKKNVSEGLIFAGEITGITANFTSMDAWIMLSCSILPNKENNSKWTLQITQGDMLFGNSYSTSNRSEGSGIAINLYDAFKNILNTSDRGKFKIKPHKNLNNYEYSYPDTVTLDYANTDELIEGLLKHCGICVELVREKDGIVAYAWKAEDLFNTSNFSVGITEYNRILFNTNTNDKAKMIREIKEQEQNKSIVSVDRSVSAKLINYNEILEQPQLLGYSDGYLLKTILHPDLQINDLIELKGMTPSMSGLFSSKTGYVGSEVNNQQFMEAFIEQDKYNKYLTLIGKYVIVGIRHTGNFYGNSINDWTSEMTILPEGDIK